MKVLVCGGRSFDDTDLLRDTLNEIHTTHRISILIHGDAPGADTIAGIWAELARIHVAKVPALWSTLGAKAGPIRNAAMMLLEPDLVVAFPGGKGTRHMVSLARGAGVPVKVASREL